MKMEFGINRTERKKADGNFSRKRKVALSFYMYVGAGNSNDFHGVRKHKNTV